METIVDLHAHGTDHSDLIWGDIIPVFGGRHYWGFQRGENAPEKIFEACVQTANRSRENTLVGLANYDDQRADRIIRGIDRIASFKGYDTNYEGCLFTVRGKDKTLGFLAGQEVSTGQGDVLLMGLKKNITERELGEVLRKAKEEHDAIILGCHVGRVIRSLKIKDIEKYRKYFDAIDVPNDLGLPVYSASDSHTPEGIFSRYSLIEGLDMSDYMKLKVSLRAGLKEGVEVRGKGQGLLEDARHFVGCKLGALAIKAGLLKRDCE